MSQNNQFVFKQGNAKNSNSACKFGVEHKSNDYEVIKQYSHLCFLGKIQL